MSDNEDLEVEVAPVEEEEEPDFGIPRVEVTPEIIAKGLSQIWNQPVVVENRGSGNNIPQAETFARERSDGCQIFFLNFRQCCMYKFCSLMGKPT